MSMASESGRIRLFLALDITHEVRGKVAALQEALQKAAQFSGAEPTWVDPAAMHLTIRFLGWTDEAMAAALAKRIGPVAAAVEGFTFAVRGTGVFPHPKRPRVIWAGIKKADAPLQKLASAIENEVRALGFENEDRPFHPHLTLARMKSTKGAAGLMKAVELHGRDFLGEVEARELILFKSDLRPGGAVYTALTKFPLRGGA